MKISNKLYFIVTNNMNIFSSIYDN